MNKKNLINSIAAAGLSVAAAMPVNAETQVGVGLRYHFGDKAPTVGLYVRDVDFRDIQTNVSSLDETKINADVNHTASGKFYDNDIVPDEFNGQNMDFVGYDPNGTLDTTTTTTTQRLSDKISGYGARINFPLSSDWNKPSLELTGIYGKTDVFGQAGIGYDFKRDEITLPASLNYSHVELGTNLRHPVEDSFIGANSTGNFKKLDEMIVDSSTDSQTLCSSNDIGFGTWDFGNGNTFQGCVPKRN